MKKKYVPVLKWKRGEQKALEQLDEQSKDKIIPLVEVPPIDFDWEKNAPKKTIDKHIANIPNTILSCFGNREAFIDLFTIDDEDMLLDGRHSIEYIIDTAISLNVNLIPVIGTNKSPEYNKAINKLIASKKINKFCIRIEEHDFPNINTSLNALLENFKITTSQCHIVIDLKEITASSMPSYQVLIPVIINNLNNLSEWISITLTSTSFPKTLEQVGRNSNKLIPRSEYTLWTYLTTDSELNYPLQFGDYCIANPEYSDVDPRFMGMSGNIRYTTKNNFLVYKGVNAKVHKFGQMVNMCTNLIATPYYSGKDFSWGDQYIYDCAAGTASTGNAETWRRIGTNHHIQFIINQLSNLSYF